MDSFYSQSSIPTSTPEITNLTISESDISSSFKNSKYNKPEFTLPKPEDSRIYIFINNLFTRSLLLIDFLKEREILVSCTRYV